jgi:hypothetical protein
VLPCLNRVCTPFLLRTGRFGRISLGPVELSPSTPPPSLHFPLPLALLYAR